ncbi:MAG: protein translocase subunit SecD, partial [Anaerolineae bacterium]|nr:protein translocase subunit SecD [Anaerolineae bacterium]
MRARDKRLLAAILVVMVFTAWVVWPANPGIHLHALGLNVDQDIKVRQGLDLSGGVQVLLEADVPATEPVTREQMDAARGIAENRVNGLGVVEPNVQLVGSRRILVELPGVGDPDEAVAALRGTGLLEFIDTGAIDLEPGTVVRTTARTPGAGQEQETALPTPAPGETSGVSPTATLTATTAPEPTAGSAQATITPTVAGPETTPEAPTEEPIYRTVLTGKDLKSVSLGTDEYGKPEIDFVLNPDGARAFAEHTQANVGKFLAITMDGVVISCPQIQTGITEGQGRITGQFTLAEARALVVQLRYGSLPVPLKVVERRTVGPTLGQDSVARTMRAGVIGLVIVLLFMLIYYRLPGALADLALLMYALTTFALFKLIPVTLTLPGLTGFLLSVGMAVDANI